MQSAHALSAPVPVATAMPTQRVERGAMEKAFRGFIESADFPCVGSKLALASDGLRVVEFAPLGDVANDAPLLVELARFADHVDAGGASDAGVDSMVALFRGPRTMDEAAFDTLRRHGSGNRNGRGQRVRRLHSDSGGSPRLRCVLR